MNDYLSRHLSSDSQIDRGTLVGISAAFGLVFLAILLGGGAGSFFDFNSLLIVLGGTFGATLVNFPLDDLVKASGLIRTAFFPDRSSGLLRMRRLTELSEIVRAEGVVGLESAIRRETDPFFRKAIELVADALPPEDIRRILEIDLSFLGDRHRRGAQVFQTMGTIAPAMGLVGTLIGLVQMLRTLSDPSSVGPGMAVALLTTFYGAVLANLVFLPLAGKLRARSAEEALIKEMTIEGAVDIARGMNPRILEECLMSFLSPDLRVSRYG